MELEFIEVKVDLGHRRVGLISVLSLGDCRQCH